MRKTSCKVPKNSNKNNCNDADDADDESVLQTGITVRKVHVPMEARAAILLTATSAAVLKDDLPANFVNKARLQPTQFSNKVTSLQNGHPWDLRYLSLLERCPPYHDT